MTFRLPTTLATDSDAAAIAALTRYYGRPYLGEGAYVGAHFDSWSSTGDQAGEADRFTADDLVAVTFLSVQIPPTAARAILDTDAEALNTLLRAIGPDRDLVDESDPLGPGVARLGPGNRPLALPGIGRTKATKLIARKRPPPVPDLGLGGDGRCGHRTRPPEPGAGSVARRRRGVARAVAEDSGRGRVARGDLGAASLRCDRVDGRQDPGPRAAR